MGKNESRQNLSSAINSIDTHPLPTMNGNMEKAFDNFVRTLQAELSEIDKNSATESESIDAKHEVCLEKVQIYERFTKGLIENGWKYLEIINRLDLEIKRIASSESSSGETSSIPSDPEDGEQSDRNNFTILKQLVSEHVSDQDEAFDSLKEINKTLGLLKRENAYLSEQNEKFKEMNQLSQEKPNITANIIEILRTENDELRQIVIRNEKTLNEISTMGSTSTSSSNLRSIGQTMSEDDVTLSDECKGIVDALRRQLEGKDRIIVRLNEKIEKAQEEPSSQIIDIAKEKRRQQQSKPKNDNQSSSIDSLSLSESEMNDNKKLDEFIEGHRTLTMILKEKYRQLREQRTEIATLKNQLSECQQVDNCRFNELETKNQTLTGELVKLQQQCGAVQDIKEQSEKYCQEMDAIRKRESNLARQITIQKSHIRKLLEERELLIKMNNETMNSIALCKRELAKYPVKL